MFFCNGIFVSSFLGLASIGIQPFIGALADTFESFNAAFYTLAFFGAIGAAGACLLLALKSREAKREAS